MNMNAVFSVILVNLVDLYISQLLKFPFFLDLVKTPKETEQVFFLQNNIIANVNNLI
jgi:hypothetical protein